MLGRTILSNSYVPDIQVSADCYPQLKTGGATIDWTTVAALGSTYTFPDPQFSVASGLKMLRYGQVLTKITATGAYSATITGTPTGGTFTFTVTAPGASVTTAQTTSAVAYNASAATLQAAILALSNVGGALATVTGTGYAIAEVDTFTPATPTAGDTITITNAAGTELVSIVVGASPSATTITTQLKQAWATNPAAVALATASGAATFILTAVTAGVALGLTPNISGTGTFTKAITTPATAPYTITFDNSLGAVTLTASGASLTGGSSPGVTIATIGDAGGNLGWYGPYDPTATDGRQNLNRGDCFILNRAVLQYSSGSSSLSIANDQIGDLLDGGRVFIERIIQAGTGSHTLAAGPTKAELLAAFPGIFIV